MSATFHIADHLSIDEPASNVVSRLRQLAPLHRAAALRAASGLAKLPASYSIPNDDMLEMADNPTPPVYERETIWRGPSPDESAIQRTSKQLLQDPNWIDKTPVAMPRLRKMLAYREATDSLWGAWNNTPACQTRYHLTNEDAWTRGQELNKEHGPLLRGLSEVLDGLDDVVPQSRLAAMRDHDIKVLAKERASEAKGQWRWRIAAAGRAGRELEEPGPDNLRRMCEKWWRRRLRKEAGLARQHLAAALGTIGKNGAPYADDYSLTRWREVQASAVAWAADRSLMSPDGKSFVAMKDVIASSAEASLMRLRTIARGLDELAERRGLVPIMITMTLPPEWHPNPSVGTKTWTPDKGPRETDEAMRSLLKRFRARLSKSKIQALGLRVWEPHKDGTPHLHALLYVSDDQIAEVDRHLNALCPEPSPRARNRKGQVIRVASDLKAIDRRKGRGSTYIMKYLQKALSAGAGDDTASQSSDDGDKDDQLAHYERHRAISSERGWRRWGFLGVHGIGRVWQRLLTSDGKELEDAPEVTRNIKSAMEDGRWADALELLGAIRERGTKPAVTLDYEDVETAYGDFGKRAIGLKTDDGWGLALSRGWTIEVNSEVYRAHKLVTIAVSYPRGRAAPAPMEEEKAWEVERKLRADIFEADLMPIIAARQGSPQWQDWITRKLDQLRRMREPEEDLAQAA